VSGGDARRCCPRDTNTTDAFRSSIGSRQRLIRAVMPETAQRRAERKRRWGEISGVERGEGIYGDSRQAVVTGLFGASNCSARTAADS
jgi:hypothetical protein